MISTSVSLKRGWETEEWKIRRLFGIGLTLSTKSRELLLEVNLVSVDPRLQSDNIYGFPESGIRVSIRIQHAYLMEDPTVDRGMVCFQSVVTTNSSKPLPNSFDLQFLDILNGRVAASMEHAVFSTLKWGVRVLADCWIESILSSIPPAAEPVGSLVGTQVNRIVSNTSLGLCPAILIFNVICVKCEQIMTDIRTEFRCGFFRLDLSCATCFRPLVLNGTHSDIHGVDCAVREIVELSWWVKCVCGKGCAFLDSVKPNDPKIIKFECGCDPQRFTYHLEASGDHTVNAFVRAPQSAATRKRSSPVRKIFKEGVPLPLMGACKHYKKSFRWIKYSCCHEWFPCNQCHNARMSHDSEQGEDMMCGHCSKQQPIAARCSACTKDLTPGWSVSEKVTTGPKPRRRKRY